MAEPAWYVRNTRFSELIETNDLDLFMRICPERSYPAGRAVFHNGDEASHLHVIMRGQVKLSVPTSSGKERILALLGPDDFLGEAFVHHSARYRADAIALSNTVTCRMSKPQFLLMTEHTPNFAATFAGILAEGLFRCRDQLGHSIDPVRLRVALVLLDQVRRFGFAETDPGWWRLNTNLRHDEIAAMISATRVATTMAMTELKEQGLLKGTRGTYLVDLEQLTELTEQKFD